MSQSDLDRFGDDVDYRLDRTFPLADSELPSSGSKLLI